MNEIIGVEALSHEAFKLIRATQVLCDRQEEISPDRLIEVLADLKKIAQQYIDTARAIEIIYDTPHIPVV